MQKTLLLALAFFLLFSVNEELGIQLNAQQQWTLEQCLQHADDNNLNLQQARLGVDNAEIDLSQSRANRLPNLNGNLNHQYNFGRSNDPTTNEFTEDRIRTNFFGIQSSVDLFNGFRLKKTIERDGLTLESSRLNSQITGNNLALNIVSAYLEVMRSQAQLEVLAEQAVLTTEQLERTQKMIDAGVLPRGDLLEVQAQVANDELRAVQAQNATDFAKLNLAQLLEYYDEPINVVVPQIDTPSTDALAGISVQQVYEAALSHLPEMKAAQLDLDAADLNADIAKSARMPSLSLSAGAATNYAGVDIPSFGFTGANQPTGLFVDDAAQTLVLSPESEITGFAKTPFFDQMSQNFNYNVGLNLAVPIFNRKQVDNAVRRAELSKQTTGLAAKQTKNNLLMSIQQAYQDALAAAKSYEANEKSIEALELAYDNVQKRYELGAANALELSTARNSLSVARLNQTTAMYNYLFTLKILDFYQGKELKL